MNAVAPIIAQPLLRPLFQSQPYVLGSADTWIGVNHQSLWTWYCALADAATDEEPMEESFKQFAFGQYNDERARRGLPLHARNHLDVCFECGADSSGTIYLNGREYGVCRAHR